MTHTPGLFSENGKELDQYHRELLRRQQSFAANKYRELANSIHELNLSCTKVKVYDMSENPFCETNGCILYSTTPNLRMPAGAKVEEIFVTKIRGFFKITTERVHFGYCVKKDDLNLTITIVERLP